MLYPSLVREFITILYMDGARGMEHGETGLVLNQHTTGGLAINSAYFTSRGKQRHSFT